MRHHTPQLPSHLHEARDAVISAYLSGAEIPASVRLIQEWLEGDGWDALLETWGDEIAIDLGTVSSRFFYDASLRDELETEDNVEISNEQRLEYARKVIRSISVELEDTFAPSVHTYAISDGDGWGVVLCGTGRMYGHGIEMDWLGVWSDRSKFLADLPTLGLLRLATIEKDLSIDVIGGVSDEEILDLWNYE